MSERHIELVACLHNNQQGHALIYTRVGNVFYRLSKQVGEPLEYAQFPGRDHCVTDARNITRYSPRYEFFDSIGNAPLNQVQLERMIMQMQAAGHLNHEQVAG